MQNTENKIITTIASKMLTSKPPKNLMGKYFAGISFSRKLLDIQEFKTIIDNGYTLGYLCKDDNNLRRKGAFEGTQMVIIDIDSTDYTLEEIIVKCEHKPTFAQTSFSHRTEAKNNKGCYHLYFCLTSIIAGERNYKILYNYFIKGIANLADPHAADPNRIFFTSHFTNVNYECKMFKNNIYDGNVILAEYKTNDKIASEGIFSPSRSDKALKGTITRQKLSERDMDALHAVVKDLRKMSRAEFCNVYVAKYGLPITSTIVDNYINGIADLRNTNYYVTASGQYTWDNNDKTQKIKKITIGNRTYTLFQDAIQFKAIYGSCLTLDKLIYLLVYHVYKYYDNSDGEMTNEKIINSAVHAYTHNYQPLASSKLLKIDKGWWYTQGYTPQAAVAAARHALAMADINERIDLSKTFEENQKICGKDKRTLQAYCVEYGVTLYTKKDLIKQEILKIWREDKTLSLRKIQVKLKDRNLSASKDVINKTLNSI